MPVRYRDEHLLVIAKPAGTGHAPDREPAQRHLGEPAARAWVSRCRAAAGPPPRHRAPARRGHLGADDVARTDEAHEALAGMLKRHEIERRYLALVRGEVGARGLRRGRSAGSAGRQGGRRSHRGPACPNTAFEVRERFDGAHPPRGGARRPAGPIRSACTCRRSGTRSWATRPTGAAGDAARGLGLRAPVPALVADRVRPSAHRGADRARGAACPTISDARWSGSRRASTAVEPEAPVDARDLQP